VPFEGWQAVNQNIPMHDCSDGNSQNSLNVPCPISGNHKNINATRAKGESIRIAKKRLIAFSNAAASIRYAIDWIFPEVDGRKKNTPPDY